MRRSGRRRAAGLLSALVLLLTAGCGAAETGGVSSGIDPSREDTVAETKPAAEAEAESKENTSGDEKPQDAAEKEDKAEKSDTAEPEIDFTSEKAVLKYLAGEWQLVEQQQRSPIGTVTIGEDGSFSCVRDDRNITAKGEIGFTNDRTEADRLTTCEITLHSVDAGGRDDIDGYMVPETDDSSMGLFHIAHGDGQDYLFYYELGNGDTFTSTILLGDWSKEESENYPGGVGSLFVRKNEGCGETPAPMKNDEFYGFVWEKTEGDGYGIEPLDIFTYDDYEEYTNRHYLAGYFLDRQDITLRHFGTAAAVGDVDPLKVYSFTTDGNGEICAVSELEHIFDGTYGIRDLEPEFSYDGLEFIYNVGVYNLKDENTKATAIMDATRVGNWIIVEGHVGPHTSAYHFFNIDYGDFLKTLYGTNLIWRDDDISTAVYAEWDTIYNVKGNVIATVEGDKAEIYDMRFTEDGKSLEVDYWVNNGVKQLEASTTIELPRMNERPMYLLADYMRRPTEERWEAFMETAPKDACLFIMENPPEEFEFMEWGAEKMDEGTEDIMILCALQDPTWVKVNTGEVTYTNDGSFIFEPSEVTEFQELKKGTCKAYKMIIPEGVPNRCVFVKTMDGTGKWLVYPISGEVDQSSMFILQEYDG